MSIFALTQVRGGVGATTLAANLAYLWPPGTDRILVELGVTGGNLTWTMGFDIQAPPSPQSLTRDGFDMGRQTANPPTLGEVKSEDWVFPVLPAPEIPDFPLPGQQTWWQRRVDLMLETHMDVIVDLGTVAPEHLVIHNKVLNAATGIIAVARNLSEAKAALRRLAMYQDRLAVVIISTLKSLPSEVSEEIGCECLDVLPFDDAIVEKTWRNVLVGQSKTKPVRQYVEAVSKLAKTMGGK